MTERDAIEQLAALLDGHDAPDAPSSLGALAGLATAVRDHADLVAPTTEFRNSLRAQLVAAADAPPGLVERARTAWTSRTAHLRTSARVAVATMTASSMIGSAGVAVAAQEALPGELLYGLKHLTEDARLLLAVDGVAEARLHLSFARERLEELRSTAGRLDSDEVVALLAEMDAHSRAGVEVLLGGVPSGVADADEVRRFTADQRGGLVAVLNDLPLPAKPVAEDSLELLRRLEITANGTTTGDRAARDRDDLDGLLDDIEAEAAEQAGRDAASSSTIADRTGVDVPLTGEERLLPVEDCDCIELPRGADGPDQEPSSADDAAEEEAAEEQPEQEPAPGDEPFEPSDGLLDGERDDGDDRGDDKTRLESPISHEELPGGDASRDETTPDEEVTVSDQLTRGLDQTVELDGVELQDGLEGTLGE